MPDPIIKIPACCEANRRFAFVVVSKLRVDSVDHSEWGDEFTANVVSARGATHELRVNHCPACGKHLFGLELLNWPEG